MNISILKMSDYTKEILKKEKNGTVHSVYRKTINLSAGNKLVALQAEGSPLSPISLITELSALDMSSLAIEPGTPVRFAQDCIEISASQAPHRFFCKDSDIYNLFLPAGTMTGSDTICPSLIKNIESVLSHVKTGGFDIIFNGEPDSDLSLMLLAAKKRILESKDLYYTRHFEESAITLSRLLGLGTGLTPGGDDFLCGVLAGLRLLNQEESKFAKVLRKEISEHLSDTIDISAAFLLCALENQYSLAVNALCAVPEPDEISALFSEIGHSSGIDTLCGVLYGLKLVT